MSQHPNPQRRRKLSLVVAGSLAVLLLIPLPLSLTARDKERAVSHALATLFQDRRVLTNKGYSRLYDVGFVKDKSRVYFQNELGIPDSVFLDHGLKPVPQDRKLDVDNGDVIVAFSSRDAKGRHTAHIQLSYVFGSLGAQGYEIQIHKSLLTRYFLYIHRWVS